MFKKIKAAGTKMIFLWHKNGILMKKMYMENYYYKKLNIYLLPWCIFKTFFNKFNSWEKVSIKKIKFYAFAGIQNCFKNV